MFNATFSNLSMNVLSDSRFSYHILTRARAKWCGQLVVIFVLKWATNVAKQSIDRGGSLKNTLTAAPFKDIRKCDRRWCRSSKFVVSSYLSIVNPFLLPGSGTLVISVKNNSPCSRDTNTKGAFNIIKLTSMGENTNVKNDRWHFCK